MSKDADFRNGHEIEGAPRRLLMVPVGNMPNRDLLAIFDEHVDALVEAFDDSDHVEIRSTAIVAYPRSAGAGGRT